MKKILFVNDEMNVGGVSRVLITLLEMLDKSKYDISLLVLHPRGELLNKVPKEIHIIEGSEFFNVCDVPVKECIKEKLFFKKLSFFLKLKTGTIVKDIIRERKKMNLGEYDVEIAFKEGFSSVFVASGNSKKKINWIHSDYKEYNYSKNYTSTMKKILKRFDEQVAVSEIAAESFKELFELKKINVIHNPIDVDKILEKSNEYINLDKGKFTFISVGRLHPQKNYRRLLECCLNLNRRKYSYELYILGDGQEKEELYSFKEKNALNNVHFLGNVSNPYPYMKEADCFVLSSLYEGLPTVVYESLVLKTPVVTTKVAGVKEQLQDRYGLIVENDNNALLQGMIKVMDEPEMLKQYRDNLKAYQYDNASIIEAIENLFN